VRQFTAPIARKLSKFVASPASAMIDPDDAVELRGDFDDNGLGLITAELIRENLRSDPEKRMLAAKMRGRVTLWATDTEVITTLDFRNGRVLVRPGFFGAPDLLIKGVSEALMAMNLMEGFKDYPIFDPRGPNVRQVFRALRHKDLKIKGIASRPLFAIRVSQLLSVH